MKVSNKMLIYTKNKVMKPKIVKTKENRVFTQFIHIGPFSYEYQKTRDWKKFCNRIQDFLESQNGTKGSRFWISNTNIVIIITQENDEEVVIPEKILEGVRKISKQYFKPSPE